MLKQRLITAAILIVLLLAVLFIFPFSWFVWTMAIVTLLAAFEWTTLMGIKIWPLRLGFLGIVVLSLGLAWILPAWIILIAAFFWWVIATYLVVRYPGGVDLWGDGYIARGVMGLLTLVPTFVALVELQRLSHGPGLILLMMFIIWAADSGAYFSGRRFGRHPLSVASPKKTWEGLAGGLLASLIVVILASIIMGIKVNHWPVMLLFGLIIVFFSVIGDLFESMLKRHINIKDSGKILPGHGGLLDRIDSLTAAAPIFLIGCLLLHLKV